MSTAVNADLTCPVVPVCVHTSCAKDQAGVSEVHVKIKQMAKAAHPEHRTHDYYTQFI